MSEQEEIRRRVKNEIVSIVESLQGCKATRLAMDAARLPDCPDDFPTLLQELINSGEVVEVEYTLPNMPYRIKSFLLPKGTSVNI